MKKILFMISFFILELVISACGGGGGGGKISDENNNTPTPEASYLIAEQVQNSLYAVYGGIGYNDRANTVDDVLMYRVMVDNLNSIGNDLILTTVIGDPNYLNKFVSFMLIPIGSSSAEFKASGDGYTSVIKINRGALSNGYFTFDATMSVIFKETGYTYGISKIYGTGQNSDLTAKFTGHFNIKDGSLDKFIIRTVRVTTGTGLKIIEGIATTTYDNWELAYNINYGTNDPMGGSGTPTNLVLISSYNMISGDKASADFRDYTVGGSFTINNKKFIFANGFRYKQEQWDYIKNNKNVTYVMMSANGQLINPSQDGNISVSSSLDNINPDTTGTIITHIFEDSAWSTNWLSGNLTFTTSEGSSLAVFDNGSVTFTSGDDSWTVPNWKTALNPLK